MEAGWFVDPLGRFDGRLFDGAQWTDQVSDGGLLSTDPDWTRPQPAKLVAAESSVSDTTGESLPVEPDARDSQVERRGGMLVPERREEGDRRQISMLRPGQQERRKGDRRRQEIVIPRAGTARSSTS